ncbi:MAG: hypothetical protein IKI75_07810 [Lachnospiraceae bacterium]|nr:hypothetical protein [Lachnospiraceae bacterium]
MEDYKALLFPMVLLLSGCGYNSNGDVSNDIVEVVPEDKQVYWKEEQEYRAVDDPALISGMNTENLLIYCVLGDYNYDGIESGIEGPSRFYGNCRYCFLFNDGNVYCANLYCDWSKEEGNGKHDIQDDIWDELADVYYLGRASYEEVEAIQGWIGEFENNVHECKEVRIESLPNNMFERDMHISIHGINLPEGGVEIWEAKYTTKKYADVLDVFSGTFNVIGEYSNSIVYDDIAHYDDVFSRKIIDWFVESPYIGLWCKHIEETGQEVWNSYTPGDRVRNEKTVIE